jgi:hypothetical protein
MTSIIVWPAKVAAIALANKLARMVWTMMTKGERYKGGIDEIAPAIIRRDVNSWEGRTARNAEPVVPAIRTTHLGQSIFECVLLTGT